MKDYTCMPPGEAIGGKDLPQSAVSFEGGSGGGNPSRAELKRGYSDAGDDRPDERFNMLFPEIGFGGFCGRPNGWER